MHECTVYINYMPCLYTYTKIAYTVLANPTYIPCSSGHVFALVLCGTGARLGGEDSDLDQ